MRRRQTMRRFLYYNQDSINSFLAQIEKGLLLKQENGEQHEQTNSHALETRANVTGDLSAKLFGIGASLKGDIQGADTDTEIATNMVRSVQEKMLHDYAFDKIYSHINENKMIKHDNIQIGDMILATETPTFLDFSYFQGLFEDSGVYKLLAEQGKKQMQAEINNIKQNIPSDAKLPNATKAQIAAIENTVKAEAKRQEDERKEMKDMFIAIKKVLPYERFLMTDKFLIPLVHR